MIFYDKLKLYIIFGFNRCEVKMIQRKDIKSTRLKTISNLVLNSRVNVLIFRFQWVCFIPIHITMKR